MTSRLLCLLVLGVAAIAGPARAAGRTCPFGVSAEPRSVPASLAPFVIAAFGVRMTPARVMRQGVVRCADGVVVACLIGANLNCGKANTSRRSAGGSAWCKEHPNADFVPMFATGHATVFAWRCAGAVAVPARQVQSVDAAGYDAGNWRRLHLPSQ